MKLLASILFLCGAVHWVLTTGNSNHTCIIGNGRHLTEDIHLNASQMEGTWHILYVKPESVKELLTCMVYTLETKQDGSTDLHYSFYNLSANARESHLGSANHLGNKIRHNHPHHVDFDEEYLALATDYTNFTVNGACPPYLHGDSVVFIAYRTNNPSESTLQASTEAVNAHGLNMSDFAEFCPDLSHSV